MSRIHARFWVQKVTKQAVSAGNVQRTVELAPVVRPTPLDDGKGNIDWSKYTPSGSITLVVSAEAAGEAFEAALGKDVAITFDILD
jgi:hypothetical protein